MKVAGESVSGEGRLPGLQTAAVLLCPHVEERRLSGVSCSSSKDTNPIVRSHPMTSLKPNHLQIP